MARTPEAAAAPKSGMAGVLDLVERVGNKVPHPAVIFVLLIVLVVVPALAPYADAIPTKK